MQESAHFPTSAVVIEVLEPIFPVLVDYIVEYMPLRRVFLRPRSYPSERRHFNQSRFLM